MVALPVLVLGNYTAIDSFTIRKLQAQALTAQNTDRCNFTAHCRPDYAICMTAFRKRRTRTCRQIPVMPFTCAGCFDDGLLSLYNWQERNMQFNGDNNG
jgi:hypothetical protein